MWWKRMAVRRAERTCRHRVLYIGESVALLQISDWAQRHGVMPADNAADDLLCVVADDEVLAGACTPAEADLLRQARGRALACLGPTQAHAFLASAATRRAAVVV
jgi:hypothetical protein